MDTVLFTIPRKAIISATTSELATLIPSIVQGAEAEEKPEQEDKPESDDKDDEEEGEGGDDNDNAQDPWTSLILIMIYEFLRGPASPWKPYFDVLPAVFDTPMFWSAEEIKGLQASPVVERVGREEADEMIRSKVLPVIRAHSSIFFGDGVAELDDDALVQLAHRMGSTIMAYSFSLEKDDDEDEEEKNDEKPKGDDEDVEMKDGDDDEAHEHEHEHEHGPGCNHDHGDDSDDDSEGAGWVEDKDDQLPLGMVPMADMLNADAECNAHISHGVDALTATAVRPIKAGEEILNYYGPLSNGELLRRYGYTTDKHAFFDAVDLPWFLVELHLARQLGLNAAETVKVSEAIDTDEFDDPIMLDRDFDEDEETGELKGVKDEAVLTELPQTLRRQARAFAKVALRQQQKRREKALVASKKQTGKNGKNDKTHPPKTEKEVVAAALVAAFGERLAAYPTTLAADEAQFAETPAGSRLHSALRVRIGEKRLLTEAVALAKADLTAAKAEAKADAKAEKAAEKSGKKNDRRGGDDDQPSGKRQRRG